MININGLTDNEQQIVNHLLQKISEKSARNRLRAAYMDGKHVLRHLPPTAPPYLRDLRTVLGWPAKAVELLDRRIRLERFAIETSENTGIEELLEVNDYFSLAAQAQLSALVHSTVFATVTAGGEDEPASMVSFITAENGTGMWDYRRRTFHNFLAVSDWGEKQNNFGLPSAFTLFIGNQIITVIDGQVTDRSISPVNMPVVQFPYKPRLDRPFGSSRISRAVMSLTDSAVRTIIRSEGTADFYGAPWFMIFGPDETAFSKNSWQMIMDRVNAIPDNPDAENPRADVKQFSQASQQPHVEQLQVLAGLFAGETNIPVTSLGVGLTQANPTSAESYLASREDLIAEAEDAQANWATAHRKLAQWVWQVAENTSVLPKELQKIQPVWKDARFTSRAAAADATVKLVSVFPWMAESDAVIETLGFDAPMTRRLLADKRRGAGAGVLGSFITESGNDD